MEVVIYGAGILGRKALDILREEPSIEILGFIDDDPVKIDCAIGHLKVIARGRELSALRRFGVEGLCVAMDEGEARLWIMKLHRTLGFAMIGAVHRGASVSPDARLGAGCIVAEGVRVEPGASIGDGCYLESGSVIREGAVVPPGSNVGRGRIIAPESFSEIAAGKSGAEKTKGRNR